MSGLWSIAVVKNDMGPGPGITHAGLRFATRRAKIIEYHFGDWEGGFSMWHGDMDGFLGKAIRVDEIAVDTNISLDSVKKWHQDFEARTTYDLLGRNCWYHVRVFCEGFGLRCPSWVRNQSMALGFFPSPFQPIAAAAQGIRDVKRNLGAHHEDQAVAAVVDAGINMVMPTRAADATIEAKNRVVSGWHKQVKRWGF